MADEQWKTVTADGKVKKAGKGGKKKKKNQKDKELTEDEKLEVMRKAGLKDLPLETKPTMYALAEAKEQRRLQNLAEQKQQAERRRQEQAAEEARLKERALRNALRPKGGAAAAKKKAKKDGHAAVEKALAALNFADINARVVDARNNKNLGDRSEEEALKAMGDALIKATGDAKPVLDVGSALPVAALEPALAAQLVELLKAYTSEQLAKHFASVATEFVSATAKNHRSALALQLLLQLMLRVEATERRGDSIAMAGIARAYSVYESCQDDWQHQQALLWLVNQLARRLPAAFCSLWAQACLPALLRPKVSPKAKEQIVAGMLQLFPRPGEGGDPAKPDRPTQAELVARARRVAHSRAGKLISQSMLLLVQACFDDRVGDIPSAARHTLRLHLFPLLRLVALNAEGGPKLLLEQLLRQSYYRQESELQEQLLRLINTCLTHEPQYGMRRLRALLAERPTTVALFLVYAKDMLVPKGTSAADIRPSIVGPALKALAAAARARADTADSEAEDAQAAAKAAKGSKAKKSAGATSVSAADRQALRLSADAADQLAAHARKVARQDAAMAGLSWYHWLLLLLATGLFAALWSHLLCRLHVHRLGASGQQVCRSLDAAGFLKEMDGFYRWLGPHVKRFEPLVDTAMPYLEAGRDAYLTHLHPAVQQYVVPAVAQGAAYVQQAYAAAAAAVAPFVAQAWAAAAPFVAQAWAAVAPYVEQAWAAACAGLSQAAAATGPLLRDGWSWLSVFYQRQFMPWAAFVLSQAWVGVQMAAAAIGEWSALAWQQAKPHMDAAYTACEQAVADVIPWFQNHYQRLFS